MASGALNISWTFGFRKDIVNGVQNLSTSERNALFFISAHSGVIYDFEHRTQIILQGHCNVISCCAVSPDKRWIATADVGDDSLLVIWDSMTGAPAKTIFCPHPQGTRSIDFSDNSMLVVSLGAADERMTQEVAVWAWANDDDTPIIKKPIQVTDPQHEVRFNPEDHSFLVTTGASTVSFWSWRELHFEGYSAKLPRSKFGHFSGNFTSTVFLTGSDNALTSTSDGFVVYWESKPSVPSQPQETARVTDSSSAKMMAATKVLRLVECGIQTMITTHNNYLVAACSDGAVRFYDYYLRLEAWFEDLCAGPITSISMSLQSMPFAESEAGAPGLKFWVPDFIVGTADAFVVGVESQIFDAVRAEDRRGVLLMQGVADEVVNVACHPCRSLVTLACMNGSLHVWDYELKLLMNLREFPSTSVSSGSTSSYMAGQQQQPLMKPLTAAFDPSGNFLAVGFNTGIIRFLDCDSFEDIATFAPSSEPILMLKFSNSGNYLAGYDRSHHVLIFKSSALEMTDSSGGSQGFVYVGRMKSHGAPITGIEFGEREGDEVLLSISADRRCVEYELKKSTIQSGVLCATVDGKKVIEQSATPLALLWHPHIEGDVEDRLIVANDEFKFKEINVDSKQCRRTTLAPTYGGPPNTLLPVPVGGKTTVFAYATASKVIGVGCLPLTGDPSRVMGLVAHPGAISSMAVSFDGKYIFSAGGADLSVNMWTVTPELITSSLEETPDTETELKHFLGLLEGGKGGPLHNDIIDYFYYCQIRTQGEASMDPRNVSGTIPLEEIASLMRAIGHYPSEQEVENMMNEVKYRTFMNNGETVDKITLTDFIKLYVNHRPVVPLSNKAVEQAFAKILERFQGSRMTWGKMKECLLTAGETLGSSELDANLTALIGDIQRVSDDTVIDAENFCAHFLGFDV